MVICLERVADLHMAQLMALPLTVSCFSKIQIGFTFLIPAYPGSPGKGLLNGCVCVCVCVCVEDTKCLCSFRYVIWHLTTCLYAFKCLTFHLIGISEVCAIPYSV